VPNNLQEGDFILEKKPLSKHDGISFDTVRWPEPLHDKETALTVDYGCLNSERARRMVEVFRHTVMITGFVFVMMLVIEYVNVLTSGAWRNRLVRSAWSQYMLAAALGAIPGCLGAFAVVAMYSHRLLSLGAVVAAMVATSGDESFVLLAMVPNRAWMIFAFLFVIGIAAGVLVDVITGRRFTAQALGCEGLEIHEEFQETFFNFSVIKQQWRECSAARGILATVLAVIIATIITGQIGPHEWTWVRVTLLVATSIALFIVSTVPEHFLEEHLWRHIARKHIPQIFLWTFGVLVIIYFLTVVLNFDLTETTAKGRWILFLSAGLLGLIPQSGPHLVFVTLYAKGTIPLSILLTNSIVQDGHGMLPLLAHSRRAFLFIKAISFVVGMFVGAILLATGL